MISAKEEKIKKTKKEKSMDFSLGENSASLACQILTEPWVTEKSHESLAFNKYIFRVQPRASKDKIKKSIEDLYRVKVEKVNIIHIPPKKRFLDRKAGKKAGFKKAVVTLRKGDKIELFEGV